MLALIAAGIGLSEVGRAADPPLEVGLRKQLFVDDYVIAEMNGVSRELGLATKENGAEPVLIADQPWEQGHRIGFYQTALWDPDDARFKLWYLAQMPGHRDRAGFAPVDSPTGEQITGVAYAESSDGIHWTKPEVGLRYREIVQGRPDPNPITNVVTFGHGFGTMLDPNAAPGAEDRFRAAFDSQFDTRADGGDVNAAVLAFSADGARWEPYNRGRAVTGRAADTQNQILWNPLTRRFMLITREDLAGDVEEGEIRGTRVMEHRKRGDKLDQRPAAWRTLAILGFAKGGEYERRRRQIHAFTDWIYEGVHFGFISAMERLTDDEYSSTPADLQTRHRNNIVNFYLATSRDAEAWNLDWAYASKPLIRRGPAGSWDKDGIHAPSLVTVQDRHWIFYCGMSERFGHDDPRGLMGIGLATLRLDGFVSLRAGQAEGSVETKPFELVGSRLELNLEAPTGELRVEVLDAGGDPIPGFTRNETQPLANADGLRLQAAWQGQAGLGALIGREIRLRFYLRDARLYAFQVQM